MNEVTLEKFIRRMCLKKENLETFLSKRPQRAVEELQEELRLSLIHISIISKQSGCGEILDKVIKTDYWDIDAMADAIYSICTNPSRFQYLQEEGKKEVDGITSVSYTHLLRCLS